MNVFGNLTPWGRSPFSRGPAMGEVPLILGPSSWGAGAVFPTLPPPPPVGRGLSEGQQIQATGGRIEKAIGTLWFFPDPDVRAAIERITGKFVDESVEAQVKFCNPTPGVVPALGDFVDPKTRLVCFLDLPPGWSEAWMEWKLSGMRG